MGERLRVPAATRGYPAPPHVRRGAHVGEQDHRRIECAAAAEARPIPFEEVRHSSRTPSLVVFVVVPDLTPALRRDVRTAAWELGFGHERVLAAVLAPTEEFENGPLSASTLVKNLRNEGIAA